MTAITADHITIKLRIFMKFRYKLGMLYLEHYWFAPIINVHAPYI